MKMCRRDVRRCDDMHSNVPSEQLKMQTRWFYWPIRLKTVTHFFLKAKLFLPFLSTPEAIPRHGRKHGGSPMQMTVVSRVAAAQHDRLTLIISYINEEKEKNMYEKKEESRSKSLLTTSCCLYSFCQTWQNAGLVGLGTGKVSPSLFHFLNRGQGPLGPALLCRRKIANPG